jgi:hypothetical protein
MSLRLVAIVSRCFSLGSRCVQKGVEVAGHSLRRVPSVAVFTTTGIEQDDNLTAGESVHALKHDALPPLSPIRQSTDSQSHFSADGSPSPNAESPTTFNSILNSPVTPRDRLTNAIRSVMMLQSATSPSNPFVSPARKRTTSSALSNLDILRGKSEIGVTTLRGSKVTAVIPKLKSLEVTQDLAAHSALVRHLQFSPNGKFLATSR